MKKITVFVLLAVLAFTSVIFVVGCDKDDAVDTEIKVIAPDGAPAIAIAKLLKEKPEFDGYTVSYEIVAGTTNLQEKIISGEADIALLPSNMAAMLYNKNTAIKVLGTNMNGLLYMIGNENLADMNGLAGKVVYSLGKGGTPEFILKYALEQNGLAYVESDEAVAGKVAIKYEAEAQTIIQLMAAGTVKFAVLGEPQVTQACKKVSGFSVIFDLQKEWGSGYPQVATIAQNTLISEHKTFVDAFIMELSTSANWVNTPDANVQEVLTANGSKVNAITSEVVSKCNIVFKSAVDAKAAIVNYYTVISGYKPQLIGGKLPDDAFYYVA